ncbi:MBL fold metallo-hydrolase [Actinomycetospora endophytica]|uniref:MBL fold metallo-hydrolase n=1 Tax=Actinomycetospora endophytica TaxID=2291215 RepID=A0ABS8P1M8_9PSEU|nr:MBL fold metallo-hydrolase [Actinomycetospora endophytica]MCD2191887.1 MBL fold metallo-hydrolase [Actinomycetospora endophytica]
MTTHLSTEPVDVDLGDGLHAYVQPDGSWMINNMAFLVGRSGVVAVDSSSTEARTRAFVEHIRSVTPAPIHTLVNTHSHPDHTAGNSWFPGATIVGHEATRAEMRAMAALPPMEGVFEPFDQGAVPSTPPFLTYAEGITLWVDDLRCEVRHVGLPAHTTNDSIVWIPERSVLLAGDLLFAGGTPFLLSGSIEGAIHVLETIVAPLGARTIVPGHGPVCGPEVISPTVDYLRFVQDVARRGRDAGLTPLEAARECDLGRFAEWSEPERIVGNLHRAYAEVGAGEVDVVGAFRDMVTFNGGRPLHCRA